MGSEEYKTIQASSELALLLKELNSRLEKIEGRIDALEKIIAHASGSQLPSFSLQEPKLYGISVSGSPSPTSMLSTQKEILLSPQDEQIVSFIRLRGHVCAADVQMKFKYKGKNAASARLSRLYELGILERQQAGRVVYYRIRSPGQ
jgi:DNA-binding transcriptional ArsR family regulator